MSVILIILSFSNSILFLLETLLSYFLTRWGIEQGYKALVNMRIEDFKGGNKLWLS